MKSFLSVLCFIALILPSWSHARRPVAATPLSKLDQVCKNISYDGLSVATCRSVFLHDPRSRTEADSQQLKQILLNLTINAGKESVAGMKKTLHHIRIALTPQQVSAVQNCTHNYEEAIYSIQVADDVSRKSGVGPISMLVPDVLSVARDADGNCQNALNADKSLKAAAYIRKHRLFFPTAIGVVLKFFYPYIY